MRPNTEVKPRRVVEQSTWQAVPAMWFAERSGFGLNALLGAHADALQTARHSIADWHPSVITIDLIVVKAARYARGRARIRSIHEMKVQMGGCGVPRVAHLTK